MDNRIDSVIKELDSAKRLSSRGGEYWMGREIQKILGYTTWENFQNVIKKARMACTSTGSDENNHFRDTTKKVLAGSGAMVQANDCFLTPGWLFPGIRDTSSCRLSLLWTGLMGTITIIPSRAATSTSSPTEIRASSRTCLARCRS